MTKGTDTRVFFQHMFRCSECKEICNRTGTDPEPDFPFIVCGHCGQTFRGDRHVGTRVVFPYAKIDANMIAGATLMAAFIHNVGADKIYDPDELAKTAANNLLSLRRELSAAAFYDD